MIPVLGYPLEWARKRLLEAGYAVETSEARSRKGLPGGESRVVRQELTGNATVLLTYATFKTELDMESAQDAGR